MIFHITSSDFVIVIVLSAFKSWCLEGCSHKKCYHWP